jgi:DNA-binding LacI/PurR family transcriptional regulator/signal transduction histidine kinase
MIGILSPLVVGSYMSEVIKGITTAADATGTRVIAIQTLDLNPAGGGSAPPSLTTQVSSADAGWPESAEEQVPQFGLRVAWDRLSGFIVVLNAVEPWYLQALRDAGKRVVVVSDEPKDFSCPVVHADNRTGVIQAVSHLVAHGHRRIAFAGSLVQSDIRERMDAYREALALHGIDPSDDLFFSATDNLESGGEVAGRSMLAAGLPSTAIVAATDFNALGIMGVLFKAGLTLPRDQAIIGFDDVDASSSARPTLSTVHQSVEEAAHVATNLLLDMLHGKEVPPGRYLVPTRFLIRESCGCARSQMAIEDLGDLEQDALLLLSSQQRLRLRLERQLLDQKPATADEATALVRAVELIASCVEPGAGPPMPGQLADAARALHSVNPHWAAIPATIACLRQYGRELETDPHDSQSTLRFERTINALTVEMSQSLVQAETEARTALYREIGLGFQVSMALLSNRARDPRSLDWLSHTTARAGCLGLWSTEGGMDGPDSRLLNITGSYAREGDSLHLPAQVRIEEFPPDALLDVLEWKPGEIAVVLPTKTKSMDLGLLALITPTETSQITGYDRLFEQSALFSESIAREVMTERLKWSNDDLATFSHAMAHDLRNPIATIVMWTSVARSQAGPDDPAAPILRIIDKISEVAHYANDLVVDLLHYAELERGATTTEVVDLNLVARRVILTTDSTITEQGATIDLGDLPVVRGRFVELELVLQNLIGNAIKYRSSRPPRIRLSAARSGNTWKVRCHDNGAGIPDDVRPQVFEPFIRGDASVPGSGLGLATCRRVVEGHGGQIWVEASGKTGTTIAFTLPAIPTLQITSMEAPGEAAITPTTASETAVQAISASQAMDDLHPKGPGRRPRQPRRAA